MKKRTIKFQMNAPCILWLALISFIILLISQLTPIGINRFLACYKTSWTDPMQYLRLFTHVLPHSSLAHFSGNFLLILALGPLVEEKYGSSRMLLMILITALITGLINIFFSPGAAVIGASGLVFMLILLASFVNVRAGAIPITVLLVAVLYIGQEIVTGLTTRDTISQLSHVIGGLCGTGFGIIFHKKS